MIPYSSEYLLQYMATLNTTNYTQGLTNMQNQTQGATNKISGAFGNLSNSITTGLKAKLSFAAAGIYVANKLRVTTKEVVAFQKQLGMVNTLLKGQEMSLINMEMNLKSYLLKLEQVKQR